MRHAPARAPSQAGRSPGPKSAVEHQAALWTLAWPPQVPAQLAEVPPTSGVSSQPNRACRRPLVVAFHPSAVESMGTSRLREAPCGPPGAAAARSQEPFAAAAAALAPRAARRPASGCRRMPAVASPCSVSGLPPQSGPGTATPNGAVQAGSSQP